MRHSRCPDVPQPVLGPSHGAAPRTAASLRGRIFQAPASRLAKVATSTPWPLYDPRHEHASCGVGLVADIAGRARAPMVELALEALEGLRHRGAVGADRASGDGVGLLLDLPESFATRLYREAGPRFGAVSGEPWRVALGCVFLPRTSARAQREARELIERVLAARGFAEARWRAVPVRPEVLGVEAARTMPRIEQLLVPVTGPKPGEGPPQLEARLEDAERRLYLVRREVEARARRVGLEGLYFSSLSLHTIVYKGLMEADALGDFYPDLVAGKMHCRHALFHQRFSTNTFPSWTLAQPFRLFAHNGEINTIIANRQHVQARENRMGLRPAKGWPDGIPWVFPLLESGQSDSASFDAVLEFLALSGRGALHALTMLMPPAWQSDAAMDPELRAFLAAHACAQEPWDGPAAVVFADAQFVGAAMDRHGRRPARYAITTDGLLVLGSEAGLLARPFGHFVARGRLGPGEMIAVDLVRGRLLDDGDIKRDLAGRWAASLAATSAGEPQRAAVVRLRDVRAQASTPGRPSDCVASGKSGELGSMQTCFGYSREEFSLLLEPKALEGRTPVSSMGDDIPLAALSQLPRLLPTYFKQRFAQVTNPALDALREREGMSLEVIVGPRPDWLTLESPRTPAVALEGPVLLDGDYAALGHALGPGGLVEVAALFKAEGPLGAMQEALDGLCYTVVDAVRRGARAVALTDAGADEHHVPIPILLAVAAARKTLLEAGLAPCAGLVAASGEPRDVHHFATLLGYGASAIYPWLALETVSRQFAPSTAAAAGDGGILANYRHAVHEGLYKVMAKMGISLMESFVGGQTFEAVGLSRELLERYFGNAPGLAGGIGLGLLEQEARARHQLGFGPGKRRNPEDLGFYRYRRSGEVHAWSPAMLQAMNGLRAGEEGAYEAFVHHSQDRQPVNLRDLLGFLPMGPPVSPEQVEPLQDICRRFVSSAMSLGSLSPEAHAAVIEGMRQLGGRSSSGEGGEWLEEGSREATIKQVASGRFGVTTWYLARAQEIEIKVAQGSKPGEGGQLPGEKVTPFVATLRHAPVGLALVSPAPHHDIYSIEDLAQLIEDLRQVNPQAQITVKLVSESGIGTIAAGVAKCHADVILVSGHDGGTGASPLSSIKNAGSPWELGLAEVQQVLMRNGLRERVRLRVDGGLKSGRDVVVAAMLGAEEYGFGTAALVALGCRYVRQCHKDTCPVGIATQRPELRARFEGRPEALVRYLQAVAGEVRALLAGLGASSLQDIVGRADLLEQLPRHENPKLACLDLSPLIACGGEQVSSAPYRTWSVNRQAPRRTGRAGHVHTHLQDEVLLRALRALEQGQCAPLWFAIANTDRSTGARLAGELARHHGPPGLEPGCLRLVFEGVAGQSFGAFGVQGMHLELLGEANDYVAKGLCGARVVVRPPLGSAEGVAGRDVMAGNAVLYGATSGELFVAGACGERFAVRNSGALAVVEGVGHHGCEYMTAGQVVVLGPVGRNFGAGMTGGVAWVYDPQRQLAGRCHEASVVLEPPTSEGSEQVQVRALVERHLEWTGSARAARVLAHWTGEWEHFWRVVPRLSASRAPPVNGERL